MATGQEKGVANALGLVGLVRKHWVGGGYILSTEGQQLGLPTCNVRPASLQGRNVNEKKQKIFENFLVDL